jgi:hypothetical protein
MADRASIRRACPAAAFGATSECLPITPLTPTVARRHMIVRSYMNTMIMPLVPLRLPSHRACNSVACPCQIWRYRMYVRVISATRMGAAGVWAKTWRPWQ